MPMEPLPSVLRSGLSLQAFLSLLMWQPGGVWLSAHTCYETQDWLRLDPLKKHPYVVFSLSDHYLPEAKAPSDRSSLPLWVNFVVF